MPEINWSLAQTPDYFGGAMRSQQAGQAARAEQAKAQAYMLYSQNPEAGARAIMQFDPATGRQLVSDQQEQAQKAQAAAFRARAAELYNNGDIRGAQQVLMQAGEPISGVQALGQDDSVQGVNLGGGGFGTFDKRTRKFEVLRQPEAQPFGMDPEKNYYMPESAAPTPAAAPQQGGNWLAGLSQAAPDAAVTSGYRSPQDNARVGGVPNSRHMSGQAVDLVPRPGETVAQLYTRVAQVPDVRAINEGDHVHVQQQGAPPARPASAPAGPQGMRLVQAAQPKPREQWEQLPDGRQRNTLTNEIKGEATGAASNKPPTEAVNTAVAFSYRALQANKRMTQLVDRGILKPRTATAQLFENDKNGGVRMVTKTNEDRQFMQAAKEWLAPILRKDTGAAVTDSELQVYMDIYIPRFEDDPQTIRQKAAARKDAMIALVGQTGGNYSKQYGEPQFNVSFVAPRKANGPAKASPGWGKMQVR